MPPGAKEHSTQRRTLLPTGTVTFLFSDIEGSTKRWEAHPTAMPQAVARHEAILRSAFGQHKGQVFKTVGDALCCAFATAPQALSAAITAQRALRDEDFSNVGGLRVRMGLHSGFAEERDADYYGPAVNRVARLVSIGHGGQILISAATYELIRGEQPQEAVFTDMGLHRLKDLAQPERVWQVSTADLDSEHPPLVSLDRLPNNLPLQVTGFFGREKELEDLKAQLSAHRLVTLCGAGGVGKTRLAAQLGAELLDALPDGAWIADFAPIGEPDSVPSVVAQSLGVSQTQGVLGDNAIAGWLKTKQLLLILDNCEHLLERAALLADVIHRNCPSVKIVVTSRQALNISGEKVVRLASLAVPEKTSDLTPEAAQRFGAVALFADRASLVNQSFSLDPATTRTVAEICRRLDGIPLAIELAAARVKVLSVANLAQRLDERFKILTGGSRTALPRQKTLAALIDWSYDLLSRQERTLFNRIAIFAGSFTGDAAARVCTGEDLGDLEFLDLLSSLADKSLLVAETSGLQDRYRLLESTRQYALEKLHDAGEREELERRAAAYFLSMAEAAQQSFGAEPLSSWLARLEPEIENFRGTLEWALGRQQDVRLGSNIASSLQMFWWHGGLEAEGRRWIEAALNLIDEREHPDVSERLREASALLTSRVLFS